MGKNYLPDSDSEQKDNLRTEELFNQHFSALRKLVEENKYLSNLNYIWESPHYREIILLARGDISSAAVIRLLFRDLLKKTSWETFIALMEILGYEPDPETQGNLPKMTGDLIFLGKKKGYI